MIHHGDALRLLLKQEGVTLSGLARRLGVHANTITNYAQSDKIKLDVWRQIATALKKDLSDVVPDLAPTVAVVDSGVAAEPYNVYAIPHHGSSAVPKTLTSCQERLVSLQDAYIELLKEHLDLVRKMKAVSPANQV